MERAGCCCNRLAPLVSPGCRSAAGLRDREPANSRYEYLCCWFMTACQSIIAMLSFDDSDVSVGLISSFCTPGSLCSPGARVPGQLARRDCSRCCCCCCCRSQETQGTGRTVCSSMDGAAAGQNRKDGKCTYRKSKEWMPESACDVPRRIPERLLEVLTGMCGGRIADCWSLGTGGRDWRGVSGMRRGKQNQGAGVARWSVLSCRPDRAKKENEMTRAG